MSSATAEEPHTVSTPKPMPRTADHASTQGSAGDAPIASAGSPSNVSPTVSTVAHPKRRSSIGMNPWVATVAASMTPLTRPAPAVPDPPATTHSGTTGNSAAYPVNPSTLSTASAGIPGTVQTEPTSRATPGTLPGRSDKLRPSFPQGLPPPR